ncbi:hypothetical protein [Mycobacteroides abscessus]|uniref:hypothetical protein n=1 Tax=Mycobacteroides abscessus TaxID=36809 RepID=UPI001F2E2995
MTQVDDAAPARAVSTMSGATAPVGVAGPYRRETANSHSGDRPLDRETPSVRKKDGAAAAVEREQRAPWVALACYFVAVVSLLVSLNTSWRFFEHVLHIPTASGERWVMFAVAELALVVCGAGMAVNVQRTGHPGAFRAPVWAMCAAMAYMAWAMSTPDEAVGRILLGPVLGTVMLHLGLGLELRARHHHTGTAARIGRELRERCLSRLGLGDDDRDAAQRSRDRKAYQAAALSRPRRWPWSRAARLERALLAAGVADDAVMRERMLARLAVLNHASALATHTQPSPWIQSNWPEENGTGESAPDAGDSHLDYGAIGQEGGESAGLRVGGDGTDTSVRGGSSTGHAVNTVHPLDAPESSPPHLSNATEEISNNDGWLDVAETLVREKVTVKSVQQTAEVLRLWDQRVPITTIATRTGVHRDTVTNITKAAEALMSTADRMRA